MPSLQKNNNTVSPFRATVWSENKGRALHRSATGSYSTHQITSDTQNFQFPSITFLPRTYYFVQISQPTIICLKNRYFEKQFSWVPLYILAIFTLHETNFHCLGVPFTPNQYPKSLSVQKFRHLHVARSENIEQSTPSERCAW